MASKHGCCARHSLTASGAGGRRFAEIGIGLTFFGVVFTFLGVVFFFDQGLLSLGNVRASFASVDQTSTPTLSSIQHWGGCEGAADGAELGATEGGAL